VFARLKEIFIDIGYYHNIEIEEINYDSDHIHILFCSNPDCNIQKFVNAFKSSSSRIIKKEYPEVKEKLYKSAFWKIGYFVVTTGGASIDVIKKYIENQ
jgi:putative transposase